MEKKKKKKEKQEGKMCQWRYEKRSARGMVEGLQKSWRSGGEKVEMEGSRTRMERNEEAS